jgi:hypothetical protein
MTAAKETNPAASGKRAVALSFHIWHLNRAVPGQIGSAK